MVKGDTLLPLTFDCSPALLNPQCLYKGLEQQIATTILECGFHCILNSLVSYVVFVRSIGTWEVLTHGRRSELFLQR